MNPSILDLCYPASSFLYSATSPKVFVDGAEQKGAGWGKRPIRMTPGPHRIEVFVPYVLPPRAGKAVLDVTVPDTGVALEYMAPTIVFAKGRLGAPGQQKSAGARFVTTLNVLVAVVVAVVVIAALIRT